MSYEEDAGLTRFLKEAASHPILSQEEEQRLARRWKYHQDEAARHKLMLHNVRLVVSVAKGFTNRGLPLADLIQAGMIGLDKATRKFDPDRGFKASTYITWWLRQACQRAVAAEGRTIRVPNQVSTRRLQIDSLLQEDPSLTYDELAVKLECTPAQVARAYKTAEVVASLDHEFVDGAQPLTETLQNDDADDPYELIDETNPEISEALEKLDDLQRTVVMMKFGFIDEVERTPQEIADYLDMSVASVQALQRDALSKLRESLID